MTKPNTKLYSLMLCQLFAYQGSGKINIGKSLFREYLPLKDNVDVAGLKA